MPLHGLSDNCIQVSEINKQDVLYSALECAHRAKNYGNIENYVLFLYSKIHKKAVKRVKTFSTGTKVTEFETYEGWQFWH